MAKKLHVYLLPSGSAPLACPEAIGYAGADRKAQIFLAPPVRDPIDPAVPIEVEMTDTAPLYVRAHLIVLESGPDVVVLALPDATEKQISEAAQVAVREWAQGRLQPQQ